MLNALVGALVELTARLVFAIIAMVLTVAAVTVAGQVALEAVQDMAETSPALTTGP